MCLRTGRDSQIEFVNSTVLFSPLDIACLLSQKRDLVQCCKLKELYKKQNMIEKEEYEELLQIFGDRSWTVLLQEVEKELRITIDRILQKKNIDGVQLPSNILHQLTNAREEAFQWACDIRIFASKCPEGVQGSTVNAKHKGNVIRRDIVHRVVLYAEQFATCEEESYRLCWHAFSTFDPMGTGFMEAQHLSHTLFLLNISWWEDVEGLVAELTSKLVDESSKPSPRRFMKEDEARADAAKLFGVKTTQGIVRFSAFVEWYVNYTVNNQNINNPKMESNRIAPKSTMKQHSNEALHKHMATLINEEGIRAALSVIARESREYTASCLVGTQPLRCAMNEAKAFIFENCRRVPTALLHYIFLIILSPFPSLPAWQSVHDMQRGVIFKSEEETET